MTNLTQPGTAILTRSQALEMLSDAGESAADFVMFVGDYFGIEDEEIEQAENSTLRQREQELEDAVESVRAMRAAYMSMVKREGS